MPKMGIRNHQFQIQNNFNKPRDLDLPYATYAPARRILNPDIYDALCPDICIRRITFSVYVAAIRPGHMCVTHRTTKLICYRRLNLEKKTAASPLVSWDRPRTRSTLQQHEVTGYIFLKGAATDCTELESFHQSWSILKNSEKSQ